MKHTMPYTIVKVWLPDLQRLVTVPVSKATHATLVALDIVGGSYEAKTKAQQVDMLARSIAWDPKYQSVT